VWMKRKWLTSICLLNSLRVLPTASSLLLRLAECPRITGARREAAGIAFGGAVSKPWGIAVLGGGSDGIDDENKTTSLDGLKLCASNSLRTNAGSIDGTCDLRHSGMSDEDGGQSVANGVVLGFAWLSNISSITGSEG